MSIGEGPRTQGESRSTSTRADALTPPGSREFWTRSVLDSLSPDWRVIHGRHWPGRSFDTVDHIVVGPTGIFIVDSVGWSGPVSFTPDLLEVNGRSRVAAVQSSHDIAREVALLLPSRLREHCFAVLCFARDEVISGWVKGVRICSTGSLDELIEGRDLVLTDAEVDEIARGLDAALPSGYAAPVERTRASDVTPHSGLTAPLPTTTSQVRGWHRSRAGRIAEAASALSVVAVLAVAGIRVTTVHPASDDAPGPDHPTSSPHQR
jgi:hypothetical protein